MKSYELEAATAIGQIRGQLEQMEKRGEDAHARTAARLRDLEKKDNEILAAMAASEEKLSARLARFGWTLASAAAVVAIELAIMLLRGGGGG